MKKSCRFFQKPIGICHRYCFMMIIRPFGRFNARFLCFSLLSDTTTLSELNLNFFLCFHRISENAFLTICYRFIRIFKNSLTKFTA